MQNSKTALTITGMALILATGSGINAHADSIDFLDANNSLNVTVTYLSPKDNTIHTESTLAGNYDTLVNGVLEHTFCTDVSDSIYPGEPWTATQGTTSGANGIGTTWYGGTTPSVANVTNYGYYGGTITPANINAIDYLIQHDSTTPSFQTNGDAQLAVWDLSLNGGVTKVGSNYDWSSVFSATGQGNIADVYSLEQAALDFKGQSGSIFENAGPGDPSGRPQDLAFAAPIPESSTVIGFSSLLIMGGLSCLRLRRRPVHSASGS
jgi:hypothetical protein